MLNSDHMAHLHHGNALELLWTITPAAILWAIGLPSLRLLYMMDEILDPELSVKVIHGFRSKGARSKLVVIFIGNNLRCY